MREQLTSVAKYDSGIAEYVDLHGAYDDTGGDVESPTGWFGLAGRRVIQHDTIGAVTTIRFASRQIAESWFAVLLNDYDEWMYDGEDDEETPGPSFLPLGTGGLRDEVAYAESFTDEDEEDGES